MAQENSEPHMVDGEVDMKLYSADTAHVQYFSPLEPIDDLSEHGGFSVGPFISPEATGIVIALHTPEGHHMSLTMDAVAFRHFARILAEQSAQLQIAEDARKASRQ